MTEITGYQYGCYFFPVINRSGVEQIHGLCNVKYANEKELLKDYDACSPGTKLEKHYTDGSVEVLRQHKKY